MNIPVVIPPSPPQGGACPPPPPPVRRPNRACTPCDPSFAAFQAFAAAAAADIVTEARRPNRHIGLVSADPTAVVAAGASVTFAGTLPMGWSALALTIFAPPGIWLVTDYSVNGVSQNTGGVPTGAYDPGMPHIDKHLLVTDMKFKNAVPISLTVRNITAADQLWPGGAVAAYNPFCQGDFQAQGEPLPGAGGAYYWAQLYGNVAAVFGW